MNGEGGAVQLSTKSRGNVIRVEILKMKKCLILDKCGLQTDDMEIQAVGWREAINQVFPSVCDINPKNSPAFFLGQGQWGVSWGLEPAGKM